MIKVRMNSARSGVLYHYTQNMDAVRSIIKNGLRTSKFAEPHMNKQSANNLKIKNTISKAFASDPTSAFVSLSRNPSIMPHEGAYDGMSKDIVSWRYGVIFSADRLNALTRIKPYQYNTSHHMFDLVVSALKDNPGSFVYSTDTSDYKYAMSKGEPEGKQPLDKFLDNFYEYQTETANSNIPVKCTERRGSWIISGELTPEYEFLDLPKFVQDLLLACNFEAEDRAFFPKADTHEFIEATKKAIIGVIVPDTEYNTETVQHFIADYPKLPVYVYRDPIEKMPEDVKLPKQLYQLPIDG